jgi:hypothetical protein
MQMAFRGLFIGIDRYASKEIDELTCARRDAMALEALFSDTLGGTTSLLTDGDATRPRIEAEFASLSDCNSDDTVVIAFSGHGSETHELVSYDADLTDLSRTAIPLDLLQEWFSSKITRTSGVGTAGVGGIEPPNDGIKIRFRVRREPSWRRNEVSDLHSLQMALECFCRSLGSALCC